MSKILWPLVLPSLLVTSLAGCAHPVPGDLDPTFGANGKVITDLGGDGGISALAIQPDGKIVAAGSVSLRFSPYNFALARYNTDGSLDPTFGTNGTVITNTLTSVRRFVRDLRPTYLTDLGMLPALEILVRESNASFAVEGQETRLDAERELALFRIVQESLRNIAKHAHAKNAAVTLSFDSNEVAATIQDDGAGFDAPEAPTAYARAGHFGLMGMQERAQLLGGNVYVKSERGKGTKVVAYVPLKS